jgi:pimeloyl-ACP methyl ester carboxylesterase
VSEVERTTEVARVGDRTVEFRLERHGGDVVLVLLGGHCRAGLVLGEQVFAEAGYGVLAVSRPGYGRTPLSTDPSVAEFTDVIAGLCAQLGIGRLVAVVGISGAGPTAVTLAARHPDLVERLILLSAVGWVPWPTWRIRVGSYIGFNAWTEPVTWFLVRAMLRVAPGLGSRMLLRGLSTMPAGQALATLSEQDRAALLAICRRLRSGSGFLNDLHSTPNVCGEITQPTLVIATRNDGGVPFAHAESLAATIRRAELVESGAGSHFIWFSADWPAIAERLTAFLTRPLTPN